MSSLYIDRRGVELEADGEALVFRENGERIGTVPLAPLSRIFFCEVMSGCNRVCLGNSAHAASA